MGILAFDHQELEYAPMLPSLCTLFLFFATPTETLGMLKRIIVLGSTKESKIWGYAPVNHRDSCLFNYVFVDVIKANLPKLHTHAMALVPNIDAWAEVWNELFHSVFISHLPLASIFRVMDSFVFEGFKILYRVTLAVLKAVEKHLCSAESIQSMKSIIHKEFTSLDGSHFEEVYKSAYSAKVERAALVKFRCVSLPRLSSSSISSLLSAIVVVAGFATPRLSTSSSARQGPRTRQHQSSLTPLRSSKIPTLSHFGSKFPRDTGCRTLSSSLLHARVDTR